MATASGDNIPDTSGQLRQRNVAPIVSINTK